MASKNAAIFRRGQKKELFDDKQEEEGWDEGAELRQKLGDLKKLWGAARTGTNLSAAIWRPESGVAEVVLQKGKLFAHMGFTQGSKLYLHIEEAVYLVDRTDLLLFLQGPGRQQRLLSLQEAYDLMVGCGVGMDRYLVYSKLMRAGYIVQRHPAKWTLKISESPRQVWARWYPQPQEPGGAGGTGAQQQAGQARQQQQKQQQQQAGPPPAGGPPPASGAPGAAAAAAGAVPPAAARALPGKHMGRGTKRKREQAQHGSWFSAGMGGLPWLQGLPADFEASLPLCEVAPDSRATWAEGFPAMRPLATLPDSELAVQCPDSEGNGMLDYDVYEPNSRFARKSAGTPAFCVAVLPPSAARAGAGVAQRWDQPFVELPAAAAAVRASGIPVNFATVEGGDIAFYSLAPVELHSIL